jgi:hypothetical protein
MEAKVREFLNASAPMLHVIFPLTKVKSSFSILHFVLDYLGVQVSFENHTYRKRRYRAFSD